MCIQNISAPNLRRRRSRAVQKVAGQAPPLPPLFPGLYAWLGRTAVTHLVPSRVTAVTAGVTPHQTDQSRSAAGPSQMGRLFPGPRPCRAGVGQREGGGSWWRLGRLPLIRTRCGGAPRPAIHMPHHLPADSAPYDGPRKPSAAFRLSARYDDQRAAGLTAGDRAEGMPFGRPTAGC